MPSSTLRYLMAPWQIVLTYVIGLAPFVHRVVDLILSLISSCLRVFHGAVCPAGITAAPRPQRPLKLFEFEACPYSRLVRETLSVLDLEFEDYPCPHETFAAWKHIQNGRFRPQLAQVFGKSQVPCLIDDNTGVKLLESQRIIDYLWATYGANCRRPLNSIFARFMIPSEIASALRPLPEQGWLRVASKEPRQMLVLYQYEASPFCRLVREVLCSLELPYYVKNVAYGSTKVHELVAVSGHDTVPFLIDPNTNFRSRETLQIVKYLWATYQQGPLSRENWIKFNLDSSAVPNAPSSQVSGPTSSNASIISQPILQQQQQQPVGVKPIRAEGEIRGQQDLRFRKDLPNIASSGIKPETGLSYS